MSKLVKLGASDVKFWFGLVWFGLRIEESLVVFWWSVVGSLTLFDAERIPVKDVNDRTEQIRQRELRVE